jgi:hypothetical protein
MRRRFVATLMVGGLLSGFLVSGTATAADGGSVTLSAKPTSASQGGAPTLNNLNIRITSPAAAGGSEFTPPYVDYLSSSVWLVANGLNPLSNEMSGVQRPLHLGGPRLVAPGAVSGQGAAGTLVPYRDPSAKFSRNILIPRDFSASPMQTEPHIAINPDDPDHLIVGMIDYNFPGVTSYVSIDGGESWEGPVQLKHPRDEIASAGDPVVAFDSDGTAHMIFISIDSEEFSLGNIIGSALVSSISVSSSTDGGFSWSTGVATTRSTVETEFAVDSSGRVRGTLGTAFLDKPWIAIGPNPDDPSRDIIYITYTNFISTFSIFYTDELPFIGSPVNETVIEMVKSEDGGITWSEPTEISPRIRQVFDQGRRGPADEESNGFVVEDPESPFTVPGGQAIEGRLRIVQGSQPAVAPDGTVYVGWMDTTDDGPFEGLAQMFVASSDDGGETWSPGRRVSTFLEPGFSPRTAFFRYWGSAFAQMATGPEGEVYVGYIGLPPGTPSDDGDLFVARSLDGGQTWGTPVKVNDDDTGRMQFFSSIETSPDGRLHAMWGDMRDDPKELRYHIYYAVSENQGESFGLNARVTDSSSNPNWGFPGGQFIGDYFSIAATDEDVYLVWADSRLGEFQGINQKIAFARQRQLPNPSIFLSPPEGAGGQPITIQGFNFQGDQDLFIQISGSLVTTARTSPLGTFMANLFIPIAGEGAHDVAVLDASGNVARASYFMSFGFDTIRDTADQVDKIEATLSSGFANSLRAGLSTELASGLDAQSASLTSGLGDIESAIARLQAAQDDLQTEIIEVDRLARIAADRPNQAVVLALVAAAAAAIFAAIAGATAWWRRRTPTGPAEA